MICKPSLVSGSLLMLLQKMEHLWNSWTAILECSWSIGEQLLKTCPMIKSPKKVEGSIGAFSNCSLNATVLLDECVHRSLAMENWIGGIWEFGV